MFVPGILLAPLVPSGVVSFGMRAGTAGAGGGGSGPNASGEVDESGA